MVGKRLNVDVVIIGAGFAGAATAYHLSRRSQASILMLEREKAPGLHSSGRNASLVLQTGSDALVRELTALSRDEYASRAEELGFTSSGSIQTGSRQALADVRGQNRIETSWMSPQEVRRAVPQARGYEFEQALFTPGDGVMDIQRLMDFYLEGARMQGVGLRTSSGVEDISGRGPFLIRAGGTSIEAARLVNAAGAWAERVARMAGLDSPPLVPKKRHLFHLPAPGVSPRQPFLWDLDKDFYFRPQGDGLLFSLCDEEADDSLDTTPSPDIEARLKNFLKANLPALCQSPATSVRACFRTHAQMSGPLLGFHRQCADFFWVAGLGGFGMGASWEIGRRAAEAFLSR
ncbi:MAG TPA: FAD-dependent oxidoreductase [Acidobacteriota bacterium]|nr:FAD-dependent oxidoreductase [Acidobacteriota bacterium]